MNTESNDRLTKIKKYVSDFETYSDRAQGMQMMLVMCLKAGLPMPSIEIIEEQLNKGA